MSVEISERRRVVLAAVLLSAASVAPAAADTLVSGTISANTTWTTGGSPYVVTGTITVSGPSGSPPVLTINPGVTVRFRAGTELRIGYGSGYGYGGPGYQGRTGANQLSFRPGTVAGSNTIAGGNQSGVVGGGYGGRYR